jgi:UDP-N-acetylmuramoyl-tripeptide--D-alanyl-D-alanine ligase
MTLIDPPPTHFAIDSREVKEGSLFFALEGEKVDGHSFLKEVKERGGCGAVVRERFNGESFGLNLIHVRSPLELLQNLAKKKVETGQSEIVGITGSVGKTTTKEWVATLLNEAFPTAYNRGSENTKITLPLTVLNHWNGEKHLVLEMGMTHRGDLSRLVAIAPPKIALVTSIALSHAMNFSSLQGIAEGKSEIFTHPQTAVALLPYEVEEKNTLLASVLCPHKTFSSRHKEADFYLEERGDLLIAQEKKEKVELYHPHFPKHLLTNLAGAILTVRCKGLSWEVINEGLKKLKMPPKRMEWVNRGSYRILNDSYNANEISTKGALDTLAEQNGRKIVVFGAIGELGSFCEGCHASIGNYALDKADLLFCLHEDSTPTHNAWVKQGKKSFLFHSKEELAKSLKQHLEPGDTVLLKGSKRHALWTLIEEILG